MQINVYIKMTYILHIHGKGLKSLLQLGPKELLNVLLQIKFLYADFGITLEQYYFIYYRGEEWL